MEFIKSIFVRVSGWLSRPITYIATQVVELTAPVVIWLFRNDSRLPTPSPKSWMKALLGVGLAVLFNSLVATFVVLLITAITFVLAFVLPALLANLIASFAACFYVFYVFLLASDNMPEEITVAV